MTLQTRLSKFHDTPLRSESKRRRNAITLLPRRGHIPRTPSLQNSHSEYPPQEGRKGCYKHTKYVNIVYMFINLLIQLMFRNNKKILRVLYSLSYLQAGMSTSRSKHMNIIVCKRHKSQQNKQSCFRCATSNRASMSMGDLREQ